MATIAIGERKVRERHQEQGENSSEIRTFSEAHEVGMEEAYGLIFHLSYCQS